jgi:hypothetical protein
MVDYSQISVPDDKPPKEYTYNERRAELLELIERKGHPWGFNYSQLGRRYGVSHKTISSDFDKLKDWYQDRIGSDAKVSSDLAYRRIVQEHMDNGDYEKARRALDSWNGWLQDTGEQDSEPEKLKDVSDGDGFGTTVILDSEYVDDE